MRIFTFLLCMLIGIPCFSQVLTCQKLSEDIGRWYSINENKNKCKATKIAKEGKEQGFPRWFGTGKYGYRYVFHLDKSASVENLREETFNYFNHYFGYDVNECFRMQDTYQSDTVGFETTLYELAKYKELAISGEIRGKVGFDVDLFSDSIVFNIKIRDYTLIEDKKSYTLHFASQFPMVSESMNLNPLDKKRKYFATAYISLNSLCLGYALGYRNYMTKKLNEKWQSVSLLREKPDNSRHLTFDGVPIYGNVDSFVGKLQSKGYPFTNQNGIYKCNHVYCGIPDCTISVFYNDTDRKVYLLSVTKNDNLEKKVNNMVWYSYPYTVNNFIIKNYKVLYTKGSYPASHINLNTTNVDVAKSYGYSIGDGVDSSYAGNIYVSLTKWKEILFGSTREHHQFRIDFIDASSLWNYYGDFFGKTYLLSDYLGMKDDCKVRFDDNALKFNVKHNKSSFLFYACDDDRKGLISLLFPHDSPYSDYASKIILTVYLRQVMDFYDHWKGQYKKIMFTGNLQPILEAYQQAKNESYAYLSKHATSKVTMDNVDRSITVPVLEDYVWRNDPEYNQLQQLKDVFPLILKAFTSTPDPYEEEERRSMGYE